MAVLHGAADTALAKAMVYDPTGLLTVKIVVIALLVGAAALWGALDTWLGREDAGRTWVIGSVFAGLASGVLYVIGRGILVDQSGTETIWPALTGGAAFTALLVLVPAGLGLFAGGRLTRSGSEDEDGDDVTEPAVRTPRRAPAAAPAPAGAVSTERGAPAAARTPAPTPAPSPLPRRRPGATRRPSPGARRPSPAPRNE